MNTWPNAAITQKGLALQAKLIEGTSLIITKAVTGSGSVSADALASQTAVSTPKQTLRFRPASYPEAGTCRVAVYLTNDTLETGYTAMQVGVYAQDPDEGEILYFICQAETGTIIPSNYEMPGYSAEWSFYFRYGQADDVSVTVDPSNTVSQAAMEEYVARVVAPHTGDANIHITDNERSAWNAKAAGQHASQHASGGADPIAPSEIGTIRVYTALAQLGLTEGTATISTILGAMANPSIAVLPTANASWTAFEFPDGASHQGVLEIDKASAPRQTLKYTTCVTNNPQVYVGSVNGSNVFNRWVRVADTEYAVSKSGDTMTDNLRIVKSGNPRLLLESTSVGRRTVIEKAGSSVMQDFGDERNYSSLMLAPETASEADLLRIYTKVEGVESTRRVYHSGNKPTSSDVGALPLDGSVPMTGSLKIKEYGEIDGNSTMTYVKSKKDINNFRYLRVINPLLSDYTVEKAMQWGNVVGGSEKTYDIYGSHNKPYGSYTGNGQAINRTVTVGGIGEVLTITSDYGMALVTNRGAICLDRLTGEVTGLKSYEVNYQNGVLTIATSSGFVNAGSTSYWYQVL